MMMRLVVAALALCPAVAEFEPSSYHDWMWWKLGMLPKWGENSTGITTSFGPVQAWTFGNRKSGSCALALHGGMDVDTIHHDFDNISAQLAEQFDYFVISPNLHSNKATSPGKISTAQMATLMTDLLKYGGCRRFTMVLGKGWGAALAARVSVEHPKMIHKLVLIAPGPLREDFGAKGDMVISVYSLLLYARDDSSVQSWVMQAIKKNAKNMIQGYGIYKGGHKMLDAYHEDIIWFAKKAIPGDDEDEEATQEPPPRSSEL